MQEDLYPLPDDSDHRIAERRAPERGSFDDSRLVDLEAEQESPFLRGQKRVSVLRGSLPKKTANRLLWSVIALAALALVGAAGLSIYRYGKHSWRFRIDSSDQIEVAGAEHVAHAQIMEVMGGDIGRNTQPQRHDSLPENVIAVRTNFALSQFAKTSYSVSAQRFSVDN